ncbi:hypothetical protein L3X38_033099 [Prunus dulcis]|uniref:Uncharacterized protein n=1 Tax=Prunus dulcis TaxID=3755 RepID=A0AAD4VGE4_PRUDU|nr:hypothetical protein L3X38_033099 [Prunus dulcis]
MSPLGFQGFDAAGLLHKGEAPPTLFPGFPMGANRGKGEWTDRLPNDYDGDNIETQASVPEQEDIRDTDDMHEDFDENNYYDRDKDAFVHSGDYPEECGCSDTFSGFADSSVRHINIEPVLGISHVLLSFHSLHRKRPIHRPSLSCRLPK